MGAMIEFPSNGKTCGGYLAVPTDGDGSGVIVLQEWWGLVDHIRSVCDRFAAAGFFALAPDLYHGESYTELGEARRVALELGMDQAGRDMSGAVDELSSRTGGRGIGVIGFCMGGGLALVLASQRPDKVRAAVPFYGTGWEGVQPDYAALTGAVLGHYAGKDPWATPEVGRELVRDLRTAGNEDVAIHVYPEAEHAFFNETRPEVYEPVVSALAWQRTLDFLRSRIDSSSTTSISE